MSYAIRKDGKGWRSVNSYDDVLTNEVFSNAIPSKTNAQLKTEELSLLTAEFQANKHTLNVAWLAAAVADGINEVERKDQVTADIEELQLQYAADVAAIKAKYA